MQHRGTPRALLLSALQGQGSGVLPAQGSKQPRNLSTHRPVAVDKAVLPSQKAWLFFCLGCIANCQQKADQEQCWALPVKSAAALRRVLSWKGSSVLLSQTQNLASLTRASSLPAFSRTAPARSAHQLRATAPVGNHIQAVGRGSRDSTELIHFPQGSRNKKETVSEPCP